MEQSKTANFLSGLGLLIIAFAWHYPGTLLSTALTWIGSLVLCGSLPFAKNPYKSLFLSGLALHVIGFYWLFFTIRDFGGFGNLATTSIYGLFLAGSSVQFLIFVYAWRNLPHFFKRWELSLPLGWFAAEVLSVKIFPWILGHTQVAFSTFAQIADIAGANWISFVSLWLCCTLITTARLKKITKPFILAALLFILSNAYGVYRIQHFQNASYPEQKVALVQANISLEEKHNVKMPQANLKRYVELTSTLKDPNLLIVWPETVITDFISANLRHVSEDPMKRVPYFPGSSLLLGSLTYENRQKLYNSAIGISSDGSITGTYHKQILMPFGEYTPFSDIFPWLKDINSTVGEFSAGDDVKIITYQGAHEIKTSPLICYEDVIPDLARLATKNGAEVLINITNDAWFGNTIAPYEHNLIASFRAIENHRYLLRSTNTGLTAIVDPLGQTVQTLPPYSEGILEGTIKLIDFSSPSTYFDFPAVNKIVSYLIILLSAIGAFRSRKP